MLIHVAKSVLLVTVVLGGGVAREAELADKPGYTLQYVLAYLLGLLAMYL